jgi:pSer/pThr/pTyr-binding forkhead associated (FHA) protein
MTPASIAVEEVLVLLKIAFLALLYLFIWRVVRMASRDLRVPQESMVLAPQRVRKQAEAPAAPAKGRLVVVGGGSNGRAHDLAASPATIGRGPGNDIALEDDFASAFHARVEPRPDGVWIEDAGSTNGTYVNGTRLTGAQRLAPGDVVRIGSTELRFEV